MQKRIITPVTSKVEEKIEKATENINENSKLNLTPLIREVPVSFRETLSTGSTLLDLAISGGQCHAGGVPGGILVEIFGRSSSGKTSILSELGGSAQARGGNVRFVDPEARLNEKFAETYGLSIPKDEYFKPDTVSELFNLIENWNPPEGKINVCAADSLAAFSTELEMEKGDKMGMRRAKEFSEGLRKNCRLIEKRNWLVACSNQVRHGEYGDVTPGGVAVEFYSSLRVSVNKIDVIEKERTLTGGKKKHKRAVGIVSKCKVVKSSIDKPFREALIYIIFDYGIDDIRGNLQYVKDTKELTKYWVGDDHDGYVGMEDAIAYIEKNSRETLLKERVIELWNSVEDRFKQVRKKKMR